MDSVEDLPCILLPKSENSFICILDEVKCLFEIRAPSGYFGLPLKDIEEGWIFLLTIEISPGVMTYRVREADVQTYLRILNNTELMNDMERMLRVDRRSTLWGRLYQRPQELRNDKIDNIIE